MLQNFLGNVIVSLFLVLKIIKLEKNSINSMNHTIAPCNKSFNKITYLKKVFILLSTRVY